MRRISVLLVVFAALAFVAQARAGMDVSCQDPRVFEDAAVNIVFVPPESSGGQLSTRAQELVVLMQRQTLLTLLPYRSIGVERLYAPTSRPCEVEHVKEVVRSGLLRPGRGVVFISGRIYEESKGIYVQTFVDFGFHRASDTISFAVPAGEKPDVFVVEPSQRVVTFAPRRLSGEVLEQLHADYQSAAVLHREPDDNSPGEALQLQPRVPFAYIVTDVKGEWIRVASLMDGRSGWIRGASGSRGSTVANVLPELNAIEGAVGYLMVRAKAPGGQGQVHFDTALGHDELEKMTSSAISRYLERVSAFESRRTLSTLHTLLGIVHLPVTVIRPTDAGLAEPENEFDRALKLDAYNSDALQLRSLLRLTMASSAPSSQDRALVSAHDDLWKAVALSPEEPGITRNLAHLYRLPAARPELFGLRSDDVQHRITQLEAATPAR